MDFARTPQARIPSGPLEDQSRESSFWKTYKTSIFVKYVQPISHIHFRPTAPHRYVVTSGARIQIYSPQTDRVVKTIARFKDTAKSAEFRNDGQLVVAGDDSGQIYTFNVATREVLRSWKAHEQPVQATHFAHEGRILSASADATVRLWDIGTSEQVAQFSRHSDYVRAAQEIPNLPSLVVSGAYDGTVRLWDIRMAERGGQVWSKNHGRPVECISVNKEGTELVSAGGPELKVWNMLQSSDTLPVHTVSQHRKTITSLAWCDNHNERRLLSGALDGLVKVYDPSDAYSVKHTMRYGGQVMSVSVSPDMQHLVTGLVDGSLSIRARKKSSKRAAAGIDESLKESYMPLLNAPAPASAPAEPKPKEPIVAPTRRKQLSEWDRMIKDFRFSDALDLALANDTSPLVTMSVLKELLRINALHLALANRDDIALEPVCRFILKNATNVYFGPLVATTAQMVLDQYASIMGLSPLIDDLLLRVYDKVNAELELDKTIRGVCGALELVSAADTVRR